MNDGKSDEPPSIEHEYDAETPASIAVIQAICAVEDIDPAEAPVELGLVLYEQIDPTALDMMVADGTGDGETAISFDLSNVATYHVEVRNDGQITVHSSM